MNVSRARNPSQTSLPVGAAFVNVNVPVPVPEIHLKHCFRRCRFRERERARARARNPPQTFAAGGAAIFL